MYGLDTVIHVTTNRTEAYTVLKESVLEDVTPRQFENPTNLEEERSGSSESMQLVQ